MQTVAGLDPSLTSFGMCLYDLDTGNVRTAIASDKTPATALADRLGRYERITAEVLGFLPRGGSVDIPPYPRLVAIEGYSYNSKGRGVFDRLEFGGILREVLVNDYQYPLIEVPPALLKKFIIGKGGGKGIDKTAMALAAYKRYGVEFATSDEVDAYGLARLAACLVGAEQPATTFQREVIEKLRSMTKRPAGGATCERK